jgi:aminoglycoside phosphotransferase (APT) family kinase protein
MEGSPPSRTALPTSGTENAIYRLGDEMVVRLPYRPVNDDQADKLEHWLPLLARDGRLSAVIDWGGLGAGDAATDPLPALNPFRGASRNAYRDVLGVDEAAWARGRAQCRTATGSRSLNGTAPPRNPSIRS